jgi:hypothetical protein
MTLKQFIQLAAGIVMGVLFFRLQILPIIKYPLSFISVLIGFLMAFVPINGRPFTSWLVAFFKAIYSPTEYVWIPDPEVVLPPPVITPPPPAPAPLQVPVKETTLPMSPPLIIPQSPLPFPITTPSPTSRMAGIATTQTTRAPGEKIPAPATAPSPPPPPPAPPKAPSMVEKISPPPPTTPAAPLKFTAPPSNVSPSPVSSAPAASVTSMISAPTSPNILSGLVIDPQGQPLPNTTVEIIDTQTGIPARALRSNKLGQFQIAIPLPAGTYNVVAEKEGTGFDPVSVSVKGSLVPPVIIQGKKI